MEKAQSQNLVNTLERMLKISDVTKNFKVLPHVLPVFVAPATEFVCIWYQGSFTADWSNIKILEVPDYCDYEVYTMFIRVASGNGNIDVISAVIPNAWSLSETNQLVSSTGFYHLMLTADQTSFRLENSNPLPLAPGSYIYMDGSFVSGTTNIDAGFLVKRRKFQ